MATFSEISNPDLYFIADTHFRGPEGPGEFERRQRFLRFLASVPDDAAVFLLGDIFDFYFEYRSVVARRFLDIFAGLAACRDRGVALHFIGGNHDYWVGRFFTDDLGIRVHEVEILIAAQGRHLVCSHGDLVIPHDYGYKILKSIIRNPLVIGVSKWIHPDLMNRIAVGVSTGSRKMRSAPQEPRARAIAAHALENFYARGNDAYIMGHIHHPLHEQREGREFMLVGDWFESFTYGKLSGGKLSLERFTA